MIFVVSDLRGSYLTLLTLLVLQLSYNLEYESIKCNVREILDLN